MARWCELLLHMRPLRALVGALLSLAAAAAAHVPCTPTANITRCAKRESECAPWCDSHQQPWLVRCEWIYCRGCSTCKLNRKLMHKASHSACPTDSLATPTVTMCCRNDGFGAQYISLISVYAFSVLVRRTFCSAPFHELPHFTAHGAQMLLGADELFQFVGGPFYGPAAHPTTPQKRTATVEIARLAPDLLPYRQVAAQVRAWYDAAPRPKPKLKFFGRSDFNVVLHVRRGDVAPGGAVPKPGLVTPDEVIAACVQDVMRASPPNAVLHVYSQGKPTDFTFLETWRPRLHIEESVPAFRKAQEPVAASRKAQTYAIESMFHHMVSADALIIASSQLSLVAGYLTRGKVYTPERHSSTNQTQSYMIPHLKSCV